MVALSCPGSLRSTKRRAAARANEKKKKGKRRQLDVLKEKKEELALGDFAMKKKTEPSWPGKVKGKKRGRKEASL